MCYARGSLYVVLVFESVFVGVALPFLVALGRLLTHGESESDDDSKQQQTVRAFAAILAVSVVQAAIVFCMCYALRQVRWGWLVPYYIWRVLLVCVAIAIIVLLFLKFDVFFDSILKAWVGMEDVEKAKGLRNCLLVPIVAVHLVLGIWCLGISIRAGKILKKTRQDAEMGSKGYAYTAGTIPMNGGYAYGPYAMSQSSAYGYNYKY